MRSSGPGGQNANVSNSAVKIVHLPTNTTVFCQEFRNGHQNLVHAMAVLKDRIYGKIAFQDNQEKMIQRKNHFMNGKRSQKNRTYNFQGDKVDLHDLALTYKGVFDYLKGNFFLEKSAVYLLNEIYFLFKQKEEDEKGD
jgi:peptide chain release factor 1